MLFVSPPPVNLEQTVRSLHYQHTNVDNRILQYISLLFLHLGLIIYLTYGVRHSKENKDIADLEKRLNKNTKK